MKNAEDSHLKADFSAVRYGQCWEDADVLLKALDIGPEHICLTIASAGDNTLAMLGQGPQRVIALDLNPAQLACLELRVAAYRELEHGQLLELMGSKPSSKRLALYRRCRSQLSAAVRAFWDGRQCEILSGIGHSGRFERYLDLFRRRVLPLIHSRQLVEALLESRSVDERQALYKTRWDTRRWRWLFKAFFSQLVLGRLGRDPSFFDYAEGPIAERLLARARHALTVLDPAQNPYIQWILCGGHRNALPYALRPENFDAIRRNLDALEWRNQPLETFLQSHDAQGIDRYNLSNLFEYVPLDHYHRLLEYIVGSGRYAARLAYWNLFVPRRRPQHLAGALQPLTALAQRLHQQDKTFFYNDFVVEVIS